MKKAGDAEDVLIPKAGEVYTAEDGTVSHVLDDQIDENYEPTEDEIAEFAQWIGMKLPEDEAYVWIAREGLKTPLPKEWKPCSTDDNEVYYFNFKTGESSWDHPMDEIFRKRFEEEKARVRAGGKPAGPAKSATAGKGSTSTTTTASATTATATTSGAKTTTKKVKSSTGSSKPVTMHLPPGSTNLASRPAALGSSVSLSSPLTATATPGSFSARSTPGNRALDGPTSSTGGRLMTEAEKAMETRIRTEVLKSYEEEKAKLEEQHEASVASVRTLHASEVKGMRDEDAKRREGLLGGMEEERERRLREAREKCEDTYGTELHNLEREEELLKTKKTKMEVEETRAASNNTQRTALEEEMKRKTQAKRDEAQRLANMQHQQRIKLEEEAYRARREKVEREVTQATRDLDALYEKEFSNFETAKALETAKTKSALDEEVRVVEASIVEAQRKAAEVEVDGARSSAELQAALAQIEKRKQERLEAVRSKAAAGQTAERERGAAAQAALQRQIEAVEEEQQAVSRPSGASTSSFSAMLEENRPMRISVVGPSASSLAGSPVSSVAYTQQLNDLRVRYAKERQEALNVLREERQVKLAAARRGLGGATSSEGGEEEDVSTLEGLKARNAAVMVEKEAFYKKLEDELREQLETELQSTSKSLADRIEEVLETDMALYQEEVLARRARMMAEGEQNKQKALADHAMAMEAYEKKKREQEARHEREAREAKEAFIQERVDAAVADLKKKLEDSHTTVMARQQTAYSQEKDALQREIDEELDAYRAAEEGKMRRNSLSSAPSTPFHAQDGKEGPTPAMVEAAHEATKEAEVALERRRRRHQAQTEEQQKSRAELEQSLKARQERLSALAAQSTAAGAAVRALQAEQAQRSVFSPSFPVEPSVQTSPVLEGRLRSKHEEAMKDLVRHFAAEEMSLEEQLRQWRGRVAVARRGSSWAPSDGAPLPVSGGVYATPLSRSLNREATGTSLLSMPSPIPVQGRPPPSLLATPFRDADVRGPSPASASLLRSSDAEQLHVREAANYYRAQQEDVQRRQAALSASRLAWQQQQQRSYSMEASAMAARAREEAQEMERRRYQQDHLSQVLSRLGERLDHLTTRAEDLHAERRYYDPNEGMQRSRSRAGGGGAREKSGGAVTIPSKWRDLLRED